MRTTSARSRRAASGRRAGGRTKPGTSPRAGVPEPTYFLGDVNCDERVDSIDAALLLQLEAALLDELPCAGNADMNADGSANSIDPGLVLQYTAGLIDSRVQFS